MVCLSDCSHTTFADTKLLRVKIETYCRKSVLLVQIVFAKSDAAWTSFALSDIDADLSCGRYHALLDTGVDAKARKHALRWPPVTDQTLQKR